MLQWTFMPGNTEVCGRSPNQQLRVPPGRGPMKWKPCKEKYTLEQAISTCEGLGGRLCTQVKLPCMLVELPVDLRTHTAYSHRTRWQAEMEADVTSFTGCW